MKDVDKIADPVSGEEVEGGKAANLAPMIPIPKKGDTRIMNNLRPISLLPLPGKILEFFINEQIMRIMENEEIFSEEQMGFRGGRSTMDCCFGLVDWVLSANNSGELALVVFIDLAKAFNTINHDILLRKLIKIDFGGGFLILLQSYLCHRTQRVNLAGNVSSIDAVIDRVPQDSVLGPTRFLCYINDMTSWGFEGRARIYADDTAIFVMGSSAYELEEKMNRNLEKLNQWAHECKLSTNTEKTKYMIFNPFRKVKIGLLELKIGDAALGRVFTYNYLGFVLEESLTFSKHIDQVVVTCNQKVYWLSKIRKSNSEDFAVQLYKSLIMFRLQYGCFFYANATKKQQHQLQ